MAFSMRSLPSSFKPLATNSNYKFWEQSLRDFLTLQGVLSYIEGVNVTYPSARRRAALRAAAARPKTQAHTSTPLPFALDDEDAEGSPDPEVEKPAPARAEEKDVEPELEWGEASSQAEWSAKRAAVCAIIRSAVEPELCAAISEWHQDDPREILKDLRRQYYRSAPISRMIVFKNMFSTKKKEDEDWAPHINRIQVQGNEAYEEPITLKALISMAIILSAPPDWDDFMGTCMQRYELDQPEAFRAALQAEEDRRKDAASRQTELNAMIARATANVKQKSKKTKENCTHPTCIDRKVERTHSAAMCHRYKKEKAEKEKTALVAKAKDEAAADTSGSTVSLMAVHDAVPFVKKHTPAAGPTAIDHCAHQVSTSDLSILKSPDALAGSNPCPLTINPHEEGGKVVALSALNAKNAGTLDSGCTAHYEPDIGRFYDYKKLDQPLPITGFTGDRLLAVGMGKVEYRMGKSRRIRLRNVYHVPGAAASLISVGALTDNDNVEVVFRKESCVVRTISGHKTIAYGTRSRNGLYLLQNVPEAVSKNCTAYWSSRRAPCDLLTWHRRLGHAHMDAVVALVHAGAIKNVAIPPVLPICETCIETKSKVKPYAKRTKERVGGRLRLVCSDLTGPMRTASLSGSRYALNHIDAHSHYVAYDFLRKKDGVTALADARLKTFEAQTGEKLRAVRTDNGGEFTSAAYEGMLRDMRVVHETTAPESSAQNGLAERAHQTIARRANAMLKGAGLSDGFWAEAWSTATYLHNRTPSKSLGWKTPFELFHGRAPDYIKLAEFGCDAWVMRPEKERLPKQAYKAVKCKFIGYQEHGAAYRLWDPVAHKTVKSRNVTFLEEKDLPHTSTHIDRVSVSSSSVSSHTSPSIPSPPRFTPTSSHDAPTGAAHVDAPNGAARRAEARSLGRGANGVMGIEDAGDSDEGESQDGPSGIPFEPVGPVRRDAVQEGSQGTPAPAAERLRDDATQGGSHGIPSPVEERPDGGEPQLGNPRTDGDGGAHGAPHGGAVTPPNEPRRSGRQRVTADMPANDASQLREELKEKRNEAFREGRLGLQGFLAAMVAGAEFPDRIPHSYDEAMRSPFADDWRAAMDAELQSMDDHKVFKYVARADVPGGRNIVDCRWVYSVKYDEHGKPVKLKARLCAKGFSQRPGLDFVETAAPTCRPESVRALLSLAAMNDWEVEHLDVKTAFLNAELDEEVYMKLPPGHLAGSSMVAQLLRAIYGLKQASRQWYKKLRRSLEAIGFKACKSDICVFYRKTASGTDFIAVHVDDMLAVAPSTERTKRLKDELARMFTITDLGAVRWFLGLRITRDRSRRSLAITQGAYVDSMLQKFCMVESKGSPTPCAPGQYLRAGGDMSEDDKTLMARTPFRELVGGLTWLGMNTRPDIMFALMQVSQYNANPKPVHWEAAKRILRYVKGSQDLGLCYDHSSENRDRLTGLVSPQTAQYHKGHGPACFTDADWANCPDTRRSVSGYAFMLNGDLISWSSNKQDTIALSSTEAEYQAATSGGKEAIWLSGLLREWGVQSGGTPLKMDNQSSIAITKNPNYSFRTKHIATKAGWLRERVDAREFVVGYVPTDAMVADVFTKPLASVKFARFVELLGLRSTRGGVLDV